MRCPCCGREVASNERCCSNCGENNEYYVEPRPIVNQPINRVPIDNGSSYNQYSNNSYNHSSSYNSSYRYPTQNPTIGILALIFSILGGWAGLVFSIIGLSTYKYECAGKTLCKVGMGLCIAWTVVGFILGIILMA